MLNEDALGILILRDQLGAGGIPRGSDSVIAQDGEVFAAVKEDGQGQRAEMNSGDLLLAGPRHRHTWWGFRSPNAVKLVVIGLVHPQHGLELAVRDRRVGQVYGVGAFVGVVALEGEDVSVLAAVNDEVGIRDDRGPCGGDELAIRRGDGRCCAQSEAVRAKPRGAIENNGADCGQPVEEGSVADGLASTGVADDQDPVQVHLAVQRMGGRVVPGPKLFQVLEMNDGPRVVLAEIEPVEKVDINRRRDDPMRCQQLAQIQVTGRGIFEWIVVAVREYGDRERPPSARNADVSVERYVRVGKRPGRAPQVGER